jgi:hypothetical protein
MARSIYDLELLLLERLKLINDWVKFAEAKNVALLALTGAGSSAFLTFLKPDSQNGLQLSDFTRYGFVWTVAFLFGSLVVALISFMPRMNHTKVLARIGQKQEPLSETDNLYYFHDLRKYTPDQLVRRVARSHGVTIGPGDDIPPGLLDMAGQIIVNAQIASDKFSLFRIAAILAMVALAPLVFLIVPTIVFTGKL